jgi:hypothetical protein
MASPTPAVNSSHRLAAMQAVQVERPGVPALVVGGLNAPRSALVRGQRPVAQQARLARMFLRAGVVSACI